MSAADLRFTPKSIRELAAGFQKIRILLTAYELGLFTVLGNRNKTAAQAAKVLKTNAAATGRLMNALCALGLLKKEKKRFFNTSLAMRFLVEGGLEFMAGLMHVAHMWDTWSALTQAVRDGKSVLAKRVDERGEEWLEAFIAAMHERACQQARKVISRINLGGVSNVLDVGGGCGTYAMAFVRAKKGMRATVFDLPDVVPLTRSYIKQENLSAEIKVVPGDYTTDYFGIGFDLVFLSAIIHINSFTQNRALISKCVKVLNPNGQVVVQDFIMDENRTSPSLGALFALNMLVATESGDTYTGGEVKTWMREAGLSEIKIKNTPFGTRLVIGRKIAKEVMKR